ncbi:MAG: APC family permease, partial [Chthoniobacterales bacterium]|nr:APC family permease [Chthoniobacterales bacterium]
LGGKRSPTDPGVFHKLSLIAVLAWVGLGADGISSACYGPGEAFKALGEHQYLAVILALMIVVTVFVISASYMQIVEHFPTGGGGYLVASKLLSPQAGAIAGSALLVDYVLTIATSIASGMDAVFSLLPVEWSGFKLWVASALLLGMVVLNLRGVKESVVPIVPVFFLFLLTHVVAILAAVVINFDQLGEIFRQCAGDFSRTREEIGLMGVLVLLLHAYSLGGSSYTGIEAVSNSMGSLREPRVETAKRTMTYMAVSLAVMAGGLILGFLLMRVSQGGEGKTLNAVFFETLTREWPGGGIFLTVALISEALILLVAAQTGFMGGPAVLANMALDRWMPNRFSLLSDRLVTQNGIMGMGLSAFVVLWLTGGLVSTLVVLYAINVFVTFFLSQLGMVRLWIKSRSSDSAWLKHLMINGVGLVLTTIILVATVCLKFFEGGWLTIVITGTLIGLAFLVRKHYRTTLLALKRLDSLVEAVGSAPNNVGVDQSLATECPPNERTAAILVNGYSGLGLHCLFQVLKLFPGQFKNFIFLQVGLVDAGKFKGIKDIQKLERKVKKELGHYVSYMRSQGFWATSFYSIGNDVVDEVERLVMKVNEKFPNSMLFGSQLVFEKETIWTRLLHNYTAFSIQRRLYQRGLPMIILPIRV